MSTKLIKNDEAEEVEGTAVDGDSLQEEIASSIIIDITYFVDPQGGQGNGEGEGESENSDQQDSQEGEGDGGKTVPYEPKENQDAKSNDDEPQQDEDSSVKTETNAEVHTDSDVFVQVRTKDRTLVGR